MDTDDLPLTGTDYHQGSVIFYREGGLLNIRGDQVPFLKRFFQIKKGGLLIFF